MPPLDLGAVSELCRLALVARRLGCRVRLDGTTDELRTLLALAGVDGLLLDEEQPIVDSTGGDLR